VPAFPRPAPRRQTRQGAVVDRRRVRPQHRRRPRPRARPAGLGRPARRAPGESPRAAGRRAPPGDGRTVARRARRDGGAASLRGPGAALSLEGGVSPVPPSQLCGQRHRGGFTSFPRRQPNGAYSWCPRSHFSLGVGRATGHDDDDGDGSCYNEGERCVPCPDGPASVPAPTPVARVE